MCIPSIFITAALLLWPRAVSAGVFNVSSSSPQTISSAPVGLHGYKRYFANDSLIGRPVPCTREDKVCFRHNLVFDPKWLECATVGNPRTVYRAELEHGAGRVVGFFPMSPDSCPGYRMAYDGICYEKETVHGVICGRDANITRHPFGNFECRVAPATPITVQQPEEDGSCVIPDLRFPDTGYRALSVSLSEVLWFEINDPTSAVAPKLLACGSRQAACFSKKKVYVTEQHGCHPLLVRGPCAEDHVVALDLQAANEGHAEGTCVHIRGGCPEGYKRMHFDGECHEDRDIEAVAPGVLILNHFGRYIVAHFRLREFYPILKGNFCTIGFAPVLIEVLEPELNPLCGPDDMSKCRLHEVVNEPPLPEL